MISCFPGRAHTYVDLLQHRKANQPDKTIYTYLDHKLQIQQEISYAALAQMAKTIAAQLQKQTKIGDRALLFFKPDMAFVTAFFGCLYAGVIAVPIKLPHKKQDGLKKLEHICRNAEISILLSTEDLIKAYADLNEPFELPGVNNRIDYILTDRLEVSLGKEWKHPMINAKTIAFIQYTSGSTGSPKGVIVDHGNLLHNEALIYKKFRHHDESVVVGWLPLFHDMGLIGNLLQPVYMGGKAILLSPVSFIQRPINWLQTISQYRGTTSGAPNFAYDLCVDKISEEEAQALDLSSWENAFNGSEPVLGQTLTRFNNKFSPYGFNKKSFYPTYGMAEATLFVSGADEPRDPVMVETNNIISVSVGCSDNQHKVQIVDEHSLMQCPEGSVGEIWVKGPSIPRGYWNDEQKTNETFNATCRSSTEHGFLRTGDLGFICAAELYVTGRIKDLIIIKGTNHYPHDIERTAQMSHHMLTVGAGAAFQTNGDQRVVLVQEIERIYLKKINTAEIFKCISQTVFQEHGIQLDVMVLVMPKTINKTSSGKIQRLLTRDLFLQHQLKEITRKERVIPMTCLA